MKNSISKITGHRPKMRAPSPIPGYPANPIAAVWKMLSPGVLPATVLLFLLICSREVNAQWSWDPAVNTAICTASGNQEQTSICTDGSGGALITWKDARAGNQDDIYIQRISAAGTVMWSQNGIPLCSAGGIQDAPQICPDGSGGAIVAWEDGRPGSGDQYIFAQRISSSGSIQWTANGVAICNAPGYHATPQLCSDGSGGAIITWVDGRAAVGKDIYAQRISGAGAIQWTTNGVIVCAAPDYQGQVQICSDSHHGAIITWQDARVSYAFDIYAQRIDASGIAQWPANGAAICTASGAHGDVRISEDGNSGAILTWTDGRSPQSDIYAQRISATGVIQWASNGIAVCAATGRQQFAVLCTDHASGAIIAWQDLRSGSGIDIYAQRINSSGNAQWTADGVVVCTDQGNDFLNDICEDGNGGAIITWSDFRADWDIYAQRVDTFGVMQWTQNGEAVSSATSNQSYPKLCSDGSGGAVVTWTDGRQNPNDIYSARIRSNGVLFPVDLLSFSATKSGNAVTLTWVTATETGNHGFEVQRNSGDENWTVLSFVDGNHTTAQEHRYRYIDDLQGVPARAVPLRYRLRQIDHDGIWAYSPVVEVRISGGPPRLTLSQNYPNPFNPSTEIEYTLPGDGTITLIVYDLSGHEVDRLVDAAKPAGTYHIRFNGSRLPSGVYPYQLEWNGQVISRTMTVLK